MKKIMSATFAGKILLGAFALMMVLHLLILAQMIPPDIVWGGQIDADGSNLVSFEIIAIVFTLFFAGIVAAKMKSLQTGAYKRLINIGMWVVFAYLGFIRK